MNSPPTTSKKWLTFRFVKVSGRFALIALMLLVFSVIVDKMTSSIIGDKMTSEKDRRELQDIKKGPDIKKELQAIQTDVTTTLNLIQPWTLGARSFHAARRVYNEHLLLDDKRMPLDEKDIFILKGRGGVSVEGRNEEVQGYGIFYFMGQNVEEVPRLTQLQNVFGTGEDAWREANQMLMLHRFYDTPMEIGIYPVKDIGVKMGDYALDKQGADS